MNAITSSPSLSYDESNEKLEIHVINGTNINYFYDIDCDYGRDYIYRIQAGVITIIMIVSSSPRASQQTVTSPSSSPKSEVFTDPFTNFTSHLQC